jgi:hypothetical protein
MDTARTLDSTLSGLTEFGKLDFLVNIGEYPLDFRNGDF